jgi:hypothetical protein
LLKQWYILGNDTTVRNEKVQTLIDAGRLNHAVPKTPVRLVRSLRLEIYLSDFHNLWSAAYLTCDLSDTTVPVRYEPVTAAQPGARISLQFHALPMTSAVCRLGVKVSQPRGRVLGTSMQARMCLHDHTADR